jgi:20S proteasome subunit beta 6
MRQQQTRWPNTRALPHGFGRLQLLVVLMVTLFATAPVTTANDSSFDPYVMNGGLLTAVAGRDFVVLATDTRMMGNSGYDIAERHHVSSRLWAATPAQTLTTADLVAPDGSLAVDLGPELLLPLRDESANEGSALRLLKQSVDDGKPPVWVGSVGCQADCEQLKRVVRADLRAAQYFGELTASSTASPDHISVVLSQILYSRRGFPFYSFCVLAGMSYDKGQVYVYDAIGSYEQVAAACTGTGKELMQPILDRKFKAVKTKVAAVEASLSVPLQRTVSNIPATQVDCETPEEAVKILLAAYRSVSEREIGVGDHVIFYTVQRMVGKGERYESKIWTAPLKKH